MLSSAEKLKALRERKGLSQAEVAKLLHIDRTTYTKYENGGSVKRNVEKIAAFFNVTTDYLLGKSDAPNGIVLSSPADITVKHSAPAFTIDPPLTDEEINIALAYRYGSQGTKNMINCAIENDQNQDASTSAAVSPEVG